MEVKGERKGGEGGVGNNADKGGMMQPSPQLVAPFILIILRSNLFNLIS